MAIGTDGSSRAGRDAQLAGKARTGVERARRSVAIAIDGDGSEQDEVAEFRMDDAAMEAHMSKARRDGNGLVGDHPHLSRPFIGLHRKTHRRVTGPPAVRFERTHDVTGDLIAFVTGVMEFEIGAAARRAANIARGSF